MRSKHNLKWKPLKLLSRKADKTISSYHLSNLDFYGRTHENVHLDYVNNSCGQRTDSKPLSLLPCPTPATITKNPSIFIAVGNGQRNSRNCNSRSITSNVLPLPVVAKVFRIQSFNGRPFEGVQLGRVRVGWYQAQLDWRFVQFVRLREATRRLSET